MRAAKQTSHRLLVALVAVLVAALVNVTNAFAVIETYQFTSPELEHRYHKLSQELRCPKCQNQTIADSNAPISKDLRELLHRRLESGASDQEILDDMVSRYGEFVRYRPDAAGVTLWLWLAPIGLLVLALLILVSVFRDRSAAPASLSEEQRRKIDALTRSGSVKP